MQPRPLVIPDRYYITRAEDSILETGISQMMQPIYVYGPRQMGKSNLLIRAVQNAHKNQRHAVYVDLSAGFRSIRKLWQHLIDLVINEINDDNLRSEIASRRLQSSSRGESDSYFEHLQELTLVADKSSRNVIVFLDESDSLLKHSYSGQFFQYIRSIYFSRVNLKSLQKVSYVLGGATAPADLVKAGGGSPFNTSLNIPIQDFTNAEFLSLAHVLCQRKDKLVFDRIWFWVNGQPRMSWDLLEAVRCHLAETGNICPADIDEFVLRYYLGDSPLEPIRDIIHQARIDETLQKAIRALVHEPSHAENGYKRRLFVAGILSLAQHGPLRAKNRVIASILRHFVQDRNINVEIAHNESARTVAMTLRSQLRENLPNDSEFHAFVTDHFPEVARRLDPGMTRDQKESLVLEMVPSGRLLDMLRRAQEYSLALRAATTYGGLLEAALRLDRSTQWADIVDTRDQADCILFLLHGQRERAGLPFFIDRICRHLAPEQGERCRIVRVPFLVDAVGARTGADWALRLHSELAQSLGLRGNRDTRDLLGLATARQPFFVLLGRQPLPPLDEAEADGLREFLVEELPKLLRGLSYLRFLLVHDYEKTKESQIERMLEWAVQGAQAGDHRVRKLDEAVLPTWEHARKYLQDHTRLPAARIDALKVEYDTLRSKKSARYDDLAALLDRKVNG